LEAFGLPGRVVYVVYGRPSKHGEATWGSLGASQTAESSWQLLHSRVASIAPQIGVERGDFALNVLNPVYRSGNGPLSDQYVRRALELAPENQGLVALCFNSIADARQTVQRMEQILPRELLARLAVALDVEHFGGGQVNAAALNQFSAWFAAKHNEWAGDAPVPGLVFVYTFRTPGGAGEGVIQDLGQLVQYYMQQRTMVVLLYDGFGSRAAKLSIMSSLIRALTDTAHAPALVGTMEFRSRWGTQYDKATIGETFGTLRGAPVYFFASQ